MTRLQSKPASKSRRKTSDAVSDSAALAFASGHLGLPVEARRDRVAPLSLDGIPAHEADGISILSASGAPFLWLLLSESKSLRELAATVEPLLAGQSIVTTAVITNGDPDATIVLRRKPGHDGTHRQTGIGSVLLRRPDPTLQPFVRAGATVVSGRSQVALAQRVERLLFEVHSDLRDIDGLHPDAALDELCKILLVKTYDESTTAAGEAMRLQRWVCLSDDDLAATARSLYESAVSSGLLGLLERGPAPRGVFSGPMMASTAALAKVLAQLEPFALVDSDLDIKARAFQQVLSPVMRAGMGQFFTPLPVIRFMVDVVRPLANERVLDPFAGSGHFLSESRVSSGARVTQDGTAERLHAIEKSDRMVRIALTDMVLQGGAHMTYHFADSLSPFGSLSPLAPETFDVVLTNPPFGSLLKDGAINRLGPFTIAPGRQSVPLEVLGLDRSIQFLRPGGRIGIVLPDGILANPGAQYVRDWLSRAVVVRAIISLPIETFSPFGANVKTSVLFARRRMPGEQTCDGTNVFLGSVSSVGYDAAGRDLNNSELAAMAEACRTFLAKEGW
jgi:type I restriction enzyme M protein